MSKDAAGLERLSDPTRLGLRAAHVARHQRGSGDGAPRREQRPAEPPDARGARRPGAGRERAEVGTQREQPQPRAVLRPRRSRAWPRAATRAASSSGVKTESASSVGSGSPAAATAAAYTSPRRASSSAATGPRAPAAAAQSAASVGTATTGRVSSNASAFSVARPMRRPVNEPGPIETANAPTASSVDARALEQRDRARAAGARSAPARRRCDLRDHPLAVEQRHAHHARRRLDGRESREVPEPIEEAHPVLRHVVPEREAHQDHQQEQADLLHPLARAQRERAAARRLDRWPAGPGRRRGSGSAAGSGCRG